jgi:tRNA (adenine37-N6)-methyltransferase
LRPIGVVGTPWRELSECPRNGRQPDPPPLCHATLFDEFRPGLRGIEGFSHLILITWLDRAGEPRLVFTPPFDTGERGVFATRAPWRPNPLGVTVAAFEGLDGQGRLRLRYMDCVDGTPLLDIKPYLPTVDAEPEATMGWLAAHATRRRG